MFLAKIVFAAFTCTTVTNYIFVAAQDDEEEPLPTPPEEKTEPPPMDNHTFVALIDIVFSDGKKRTCTGTIIHDNVVITAAHCFIDPDVYVEAELTASFVVIGTKKMYDTGYENYLPIERVLSHPKYKGWTADIALVFTFAGMTSDKPGNVIPIVGESALTPVDSNVTILSWGHCKDEVPPALTRSPGGNNHHGEKRICESSEENHDSCEPASTSKPLRAGYSSTEESSEQQQERFPHRSLIDRSDSLQTGAVHLASGTTPRNINDKTPRAQRLSQNRVPNVFDLPVVSDKATTKIMSRYLTSAEANVQKKYRRPTTRRPRNNYTLKHRYKKATRNTGYIDDKHIMIVDPTRRKDILVVKEEDSARKSALDGADIAEGIKEQIKKSENSMQQYFKNWRRTVGAKQNKLTIEIFGFVNVQTCKKLVDKALPALYTINPNEVVCYAAEDHFISEDDSGAPAVRQGHLVAVTLGGVECEGDHVAIGIKMNCFCSWIAENLPSGGKDMNCCVDCCGESKKEEQIYYNRQRYINQYLETTDNDTT